MFNPYGSNPDNALELNTEDVFARPFDPIAAERKRRELAHAELIGTMLSNLRKEGVDTSSLEDNAEFMADPKGFDLQQHLMSTLQSNPAEDLLAADTGFALGVGEGTTVERHGKGAKRSTLGAVFSFAARKTSAFVRAISDGIESFKSTIENNKIGTVVAGMAAAVMLSATAASGPSQPSFSMENAAANAAIESIVQMNDYSPLEKTVDLVLPAEKVEPTANPVKVESAALAQAVAPAVAAAPAKAAPPAPESSETLAEAVSEPAGAVEPSAVLVTALQDGAEKARLQLQMETLMKFVGHLTTAEAANTALDVSADPGQPHYERQQFEQSVVAGLMTMRGVYQQGVSEGKTERGAMQDAHSQMSDLAISAASGDAEISVSGIHAARIMADRNPEFIKSPGLDDVAGSLAHGMAYQAAESMGSMDSKVIADRAVNAIYEVQHAQFTESIHHVNLISERNAVNQGLSDGGFLDHSVLTGSADEVSEITRRVVETGLKNVPHSDPSLWSRTSTQVALATDDISDRFGKAFTRMSDRLDMSSMNFDNLSFGGMDLDDQPSAHVAAAASPSM
ncbi:MAG: hypothetical protein IBX50_08585 [Marinospirillum sp.]|uniref:hypothetical protein n=1 Tax=Marinospirillum sp. TaxID=2183934 RepID=UPI0019E622DF|nr:hypothetical protein [Marinospirillum sp.]MBE0506763.1 hypothetical protein [Marinospirillum sp.]